MSRYKRKERFWVIAICALVLLFGFIEGLLFRFDSHLPPLNNVLLFALININVILLLLLVYLVLRSIVKLVFERKRNILGHKLRTRLVIAFVGLTLIPTIPLFWLAIQFISFSLDYWFSHQVEQSLMQAVTLGKDYLDEEKSNLLHDCRLAGVELANASAPHGISGLGTKFSDFLLDRYQLGALYLFKSDGEVLWERSAPGFPKAEVEWLQEFAGKSIREYPSIQTISTEPQIEGVIAAIPLRITQTAQQQQDMKLVGLRLVPPSITAKLSAVTVGYEDYLQLKLLHNPLKTTHFITFSIITLLVIFAAVWFGFFLAKNITVPIQDLVSATQSIAEGNLDIELTWKRDDEIGILVSSFNKMVADLRESREQLAGAYIALQHSHVELEERRRYMETVLANVAAGVVSVDARGIVRAINRSAESILGFRVGEVLGRPYSQFMRPSYMEIVQLFLDAYRPDRQPHLERQVHLMMNNHPMVLLIKVSIFHDEHGNPLGVVVVFDDLTNMEKAQRMAAWREVARRIAHEIKNPLTPIQLSAQRLRRRYAELLESPDGLVLEECTRTIVGQVDLMKHLVNEFSNFARLPRSNPMPTDLTAIVEETMLIFRHTHQEITFALEKDASFPILRIDAAQFKQVIMNLLENAVHAMDGRERAVQIRLVYDPVLRIAMLECADTGRGISPEDKLRIFEPYYSTKEKGSGLGLAIVASIVADHNGFIRARDNDPRGTVIMIELPG